MGSPSRTRLSKFTPLENCVARGLGGRIWLGGSVLQSVSDVCHAQRCGSLGSCVSTCRLQANRASNLRSSSVGCLAWPSKPTLHSLPFRVRKKLLRSYSFCVAELGSEARFPRSQFPIASHCPIPLFAPAARELSLELWAGSQGPYQPRLWVIFVSAPSSYFHPPCRASRGAGRT